MNNNISNEQSLIKGLFALRGNLMPEHCESDRKVDDAILNLLSALNVDVDNWFKYI